MYCEADLKIVWYILFLSILSFGAESWTTSGELDKYPRSSYITALGRSVKSLDEARQNAIIAVKQQISVSVRSTLKQNKLEVSIDNDDASMSDFKKSAQLSVSGEITGVEIVKTTQADGMYIALAALNKRKFSSHLMTTIAELNEGIAQKVTQAKADFKTQKISDAIARLLSAESDIDQLKEVRRLLSATTIITEVDQPAFSKLDISLLLEKIIKSFELNVESGQGQTITLGVTPSAPFTLTVSSSGKPVSGIGVTIKGKRNKKVLSNISDSKGLVHFDLETLNQEPGSHSYRVSVDIDIASSLQKALNELDVILNYSIKAKVCRANVIIRNKSSASNAKVTKAVRQLLSKQMIKHSSSSDNTLTIVIKSKEAALVKGLSKKSSFIKTLVTLSGTLKIGAKTVHIFEEKKSGLASDFTKATAAGIQKMKFKSAVKIQQLSCPDK